MISLIGWLATAIVTASYFFRNHKTLRAVQALGAIVWLTYGILINSKPSNGRKHNRRRSSSILDVSTNPRPTPSARNRRLSFAPPHRVGRAPLPLLLYL